MSKVSISMKHMRYATMVIHKRFHFRVKRCEAMWPCVWQITRVKGIIMLHRFSSLDTKLFVEIASTHMQHAERLSSQTGCWHSMICIYVESFSLSMRYQCSVCFCLKAARMEPWLWPRAGASESLKSRHISIAHGNPLRIQSFSFSIRLIHVT